MTVHTMSLPFAETSVRAARAELTGWLVALGESEDMVADSRLVLSELVGNAVRHARPLADDTLEVSWVESADEVLLSVTDGGGAGSPVVVETDPWATSGRGLCVVEELSRRWWWERARARLTVHAAVAHSAGSDAHPRH